MLTKEYKDVERIKRQYEEKQVTKLDELRSLDKRVKRPAEIFAYVFGGIGSLVLGTGMCLAMEVLTIPYGMAIGIGVGLVGITMVTANYFAYEKMLSKRRKKYADQVLSLTNELVHA